MLFILLSNAVKFTSKGFVHVSVGIKSAATEMELLVKDAHEVYHAKADKYIDIRI